jgi:hypothetical protein
MAFFIGHPFEREYGLALLLEPGGGRVKAEIPILIMKKMARGNERPNDPHRAASRPVRESLLWGDNGRYF